MSASLTLLQAGNGENEPALLPAGWQVKPLSRVFRQISSGTTPPTDEPGYYGSDVHWITTGELRETAIQSSKAMLTNAAIQKFSALRIYPAGTLLIAMYGATVGRMGWLEIPAATNQACCALVDAGSGSARFVFYCLSAAMESILILSSGGGQPNINQEKLRSFRIPQPPSTLQHEIATFLDRETGKIDALVGEQERLIALLKEKRQAVISQAVTKGLDPTVPMRHSGVEWLGEVPAHWTVLPLGRITRSMCDGPFGSGLKSEHYASEGARVIRLQNIRKTGFDGTDAAFVDEGYFRSQLSGHDVRANDILIAGLGDERNSVGRACVAPDNLGPALVKADCFRFRMQDDRVYPKFLALQLTAGAEFAAGQLSSGSTRSRIPLSVMATRLVALPTLSEQETIYQDLTTQMAALASLDEQATRAIVLLRERRAALIAAAVTGKIDVRENAGMPDAQAA